MRIANMLFFIDYTAAFMYRRKVDAVLSGSPPVNQISAFSKAQRSGEPADGKAAHATATSKAKITKNPSQNGGQARRDGRKSAQEKMRDDAVNAKDIPVAANKKVERPTVKPAMTAAKPTKVSGGTATSTASKKQAAKKTTKKVHKAATTFEYVPQLSESERIIKEFIRLDGKEYSKTITAGLLSRLQEAIVTRKIRKSDRHAGLIERAQTALLKIIDMAEPGQRLDIDGIGDFKKAVGGLRESREVTALRAFVKEAVRWRTVDGYMMRDGERAGSAEVDGTLRKVEARLRTAGGEACLKAADHIAQYVNGERNRVVYSQELTGLRGLAGMIV